MAATLQQLAISPNGFVFDPRTGATYTVNPSGKAVLEAIRDGADLDGITAALRDAFSVSSADLGADVLEYVRQLRANGLLPADFEVTG